MPKTRLTDSPAFRGLSERLLEKGATAKPVCDRCGEPVDPEAWSLHRNQLCRGKHAAAPTQRTA